MGARVLNDEVRKRILRIKRQYPTRTFKEIAINLQDEGLGEYKPRTINNFHRTYVSKIAVQKHLKDKVYTFKEIKDIKWRRNKQNVKIRSKPKFGVVWEESKNVDYISAYQFQNSIDLIEYLLDKLFEQVSNRPLTP